MELFEAMTAVYEKEEMEAIAVVARRAWQRRNLFVFQSEFTHPNVVAQQSKNIF